MSNKISEQREELYSFFKSEIVPDIKTNDFNSKFIESVTNKLKNKFGIKYNFIIKTYNNGDILRVSANSKSLGIIYFFAVSKTNSEKDFAQNTKWFKV